MHLHEDLRYPKDPKTLGEMIRNARMDKHLEIKELAKLIGVTEDTVINWEIGDIRPLRRYLKKLRKFSNISI